MKGIAENGYVTPPSGSEYPEGKTIIVEAVPNNTDWHFVRWEGDLSGTDPSTCLTMDGDKHVHAVFAAVTTRYTLSTSVTGNGSIELSPAPGANNSYAQGTTVTLKAKPGSGWGFVGWGGDLSGANRTATLTMSRNRTVSAEFQYGASPTNDCTGFYISFDGPFSKTYVEVDPPAYLTDSYNCYYYDGIEPRDVTVRITNFEARCRFLGFSGTGFTRVSDTEITLRTGPVIGPPHGTLGKSANESTPSIDMDFTGIPLRIFVKGPGTTTGTAQGVDEDLEPGPHAIPPTSASQEIELRAEPVQGSEFRYWTITSDRVLKLGGGSVRPTENPVTFTPDRGKTTTATFSNPQWWHRAASVILGDRTYILGAADALDEMGYKVDSVNWPDEECEVLTAIRYSQVFAAHCHGVIWTGLCDLQFDVTPQDIKAQNLAPGQYKLVYIMSCCSAGQEYFDEYAYAFSADCYIGWDSLIWQRHVERFDTKFWELVKQEGYETWRAYKEARKYYEDLYSNHDASPPEKRDPIPFCFGSVDLKLHN